MDYARYNYVAQPGDGAGLMPRVGPYDFFAVNWGYQPKDADEKAELERSIVRSGSISPCSASEIPTRAWTRPSRPKDLGSNAVEASELGLRNLERVAGYLVKATSKPGKDYDLLSVEYDALLRQWSREMGHVANVVGGVQEINLYYGDANRRFFPNPADYQQQAVSFLLEYALTTPTNFTGEDIVSRLTAEGTARTDPHCAKRCAQKLDLQPAHRQAHRD